MPQYHPDMHLLNEYAAGVLSPAYALCVAAHIERCEDCRNAVAQLTEVGASLFNNVEEELLQSSDYSPAQIAVNDTSSARLFATIDALEKIDNPLHIEDNVQQRVVDMQAANRNQDSLHELDPSLTELGDTVTKLVVDDKQFQWERVGRALQVGRLQFKDQHREVALHKLSRGGKVGCHDHRGNEITVVLKGSFSDEEGIYQEGDFLFRQSGQAHQPMASNDGSCICLSVLDAPIKFTNGMHRLLNPFLKLRPRASLA